jgi:hypothetical protein
VPHLSPSIGGTLARNQRLLDCAKKATGGAAGRNGIGDEVRLIEQNEISLIAGPSIRSMPISRGSHEKGHPIFI